MSKEEKLNFPIEEIFGGFTLEVTNVTSKEKEPVIEELPEDIKKSIESKEDLKEEEEVEASEEEVEEEEVIEEEEEEVEDNSDEVEVEYSYKALATYLAEQGVIDFEDSEDIEDTPELLEEAVLNTAKNMVNEYKESIPAEGREFLEYLEKGGNPSKYFEVLQKPLDFDNLDLEDEDTQKQVLREYLASQDYSSEEIEEELKDYEDALILDKKAKTASKRLEKIYQKRKEALLQEQAAMEAERKKQMDNYIKELKSTINNSSSLGGLPVSASDKKAFESYLLDRGKDGLTQYEKDLQENPTKTQLELAFLKFKKFDFSKIEKRVKTEETKRIKGIIKTKDVTPKGKSKRIDSSKNDLSGFRKLI